MDKLQLNLGMSRGYGGPSPTALLQHLRSTAWTCATINASTCASYPPKLYVSTQKSQAIAKCATQSISTKAQKRLRETLKIKSEVQIEEVTAHPVLKLIDQVNPFMNAFDLWELTTLYQETIGSCFWLIQHNALQRPREIWPLPAHLVTMTPDPESGGFNYWFNGYQYSASQIIHFRYPDPNNPYSYGMSPLRAVYNEARISLSYAELKIARFDNRAAPDVVVSPKEAIGQEERERLELQWNQKFRRGGAGRVLVAESEMGVQLLNAQMGDIAALAEKGANSDDICNAFHVPLSMLSTNTNLANLQASESQHASKCIAPRLIRRDEKLNEQLIPMYDQSGRLYFAADDPRPVDPEYDWRILESAAKNGFMTINEIRAGEDLPPVPWGDVPCPQKAPLASP